MKDGDRRRPRDSPQVTEWAIPYRGAAQPGVIAEEGRRTALHGHRGATGWLIDGVPIPPAAPVWARLDQDPPPAETGSLWAVGEWPEQIVAALEDLAQGYQENLAGLLCDASERLAELHRRRHASWSSPPPPPGHGVAACFVADSRICWAALGPVRLLADRDLAVDRAAGVCGALPGLLCGPLGSDWQMLADDRWRARTDTEVIWLFEEAMRTGNAGEHSEEFTAAVHAARDRPGGVWFLGASGLPRQEIITGTVSPHARLLAVSAALARRLGDYAALPEEMNENLPFRDLSGFWDVLWETPSPVLESVRRDHLSQPEPSWGSPLSSCEGPFAALAAQAVTPA